MSTATRRESTITRLDERIPIGPLAAAVHAYVTAHGLSAYDLWPMVDAYMGRETTGRASSFARRWWESERRGWIALRHADAVCLVIGVRLDDVAPPVSMEGVGEGFCAGCGESVVTVRGQCAWCEGRVG